MSGHIASELAADFVVEVAEGITAEIASGFATAVVALFLAVGAETEEEMQEDVWEQVGLCEPLKATGRDCGYEDETKECQEARARNRPCVFSLGNIMRAMDRTGPERSWKEMWGDKPDCPILLPPPAKQPDFKNCVPWGLTGVEVITRPDWVVSDQPTGFGRDGMWMKLRLEVAASELSPPSRVRARPAPAAPAWDPERILGVLEGHVRTLAAVPVHIIQLVREGR